MEAMETYMQLGQPQPAFTNSVGRVVRYVMSRIWRG